MNSMKLSSENVRKAIARVNEVGFASIDLRADLSHSLGIDLYNLMEQKSFHPSREMYYNEIAFYWPEDWHEVPESIGSFHEQKSLKHILPFSNAQQLLQDSFGDEITQAVVNFTSLVKNLIVSEHHGLLNNELRLSRVMLRQMNARHKTSHGGSDFHEDRGYSDRPYQQLLSAIITTHGIPTTAQNFEAKVGDLLIFNAFDRRRLLGQSEELAFVHKGPKSGPKMFFFFEFLGPRQ